MTVGLTRRAIPPSLLVSQSFLWQEEKKAMIDQKGQTKQQEYLKIYQQVTKLVSMVLDHQQVMDIIVRRLPEILDVDAATIRLIDASTNTFVLGAAHGLSKEYISRDSIDTEDALETIRSGYPVMKNHLAEDPSYKEREITKKEGIKSVLALPILFQDSIIGVMRLLTKSDRVFTSEEVSFCMALAEQVGIAISNARMFSEMENQIDFLNEVQEISKLVNSTLDLDAVLKTIVEKLPKIMDLKACTIRLLKPQTNQLELVASHGLSQEYLARGRIEDEKNILQALSGEPVAIFDAANDKRVGYREHIKKEGIKSILVVPIKVGREIIGILRLLTDEYHSFSASEVNFAKTVAEAGGTAIQNARTYRKINLLFNQIEESERFLHDILDCLRVQLLVVDRNKRVVMANKIFLAEEGKREADVLGRAYKDLLVSQALSSEESPVTAVLQSGETSSATIQLQKDGENRWYERTASPILSSTGEVEFVIEVIRDITLQHQLNEEHMERMKLQGVLEMAGAAAHNLNSPLFAALGTAQLMQDELESKELKEDMDTIIRNMKKMAKLTQKMTTMTSFESKEYVGSTKIVELK